jgi:hypothetical protein
MKTKLFCLGICFALFLAACSGKKNYEIANSSADSARMDAKTDTAFSGQKFIKTADMHFKVKNVQRTCEDVANLTAAYHGLVMHHVMKSSVERNYDNPISRDSVLHVSAYNTLADMIVRVPSDKTEEFMNAVGKMAVYIDNRNMNIEDKTLDYFATNLKVQSQSDIIAGQKTHDIKIKNAESVMALKNDVIDEKVNNRRIDAEVKYSTIALNFYQINTIAKEVTVNDDPSAFQEPFFTQLGNAVANGWSGFNSVVVFIANLWVLFVVFAMAWYGYFLYKKKQPAKAA